MRRSHGSVALRTEPCALERNQCIVTTFPSVTSFSVGRHMDWNRVEGNWKQVKRSVKEKWGQLTDDDLDTIDGRREQLEGKIQERYGLAKDQVSKAVDDWYASL